MDFLRIDESGTPDNPLIIVVGDVVDRGVYITGSYVHVSQFQVPDGYGDKQGTGVGITGNYNKVSMFDIGERWRGVDIRGTAHHNIVKNGKNSRSWDGYYINGDCSYNIIEDCTAYQIALNNQTRDGHAFGITYGKRNQLINCRSYENHGLSADIAVFGSPNAVLKNVSSIGAKGKYDILVTLRSDASVLINPVGKVSIGGTPDVTVINPSTPVEYLDKGPNSDNTGAVIL